MSTSRHRIFGALLNCMLGSTLIGATNQTTFAVTGAACQLGQDEGSGLRMTHWELLRLTEVCTAAETTRGKAVIVSLMLVYEGRIPAGALRPVAKGTPMQVLVRLEFPAAPPLASPEFTIGAPARRLDLIASTREHQLLYPCDLSVSRCAFNGVISRLELRELTELSSSATVTGRAMATDFGLTPDGLAAVRRLAARATTP